MGMRLTDKKIFQPEHEFHVFTDENFQKNQRGEKEIIRLFG